MKAIIKDRNGTKTLIIAATTNQLADGFSHTLGIGYSWNNSINRFPKTPKSLVSNLNKCTMVYGYWDNIYHPLDAKQTKEALKLLNEAELTEANTKHSGCWKKLTEEEFTKILKIF